VADGYVNRMVAPQSKRPVDITKLAIPTEVKLADPQALPQTADLLAYLSGIASSDYVIYGHQNDLHRKVGTKLPGPSDTYDIVKDDAGLMGFDGLALTGNELELTEAERTAGITLTDKLAAIYIKGAREGGILSMSCHMPNFAQVAKRPKIDGKYDYSGYSPVDLSGDVVQRIMPGGDLNPVFTGYLDMVAGFDKKLQDAGIPLIFRPFHENNGAWFWWGASSCSPSQFKNLFRYTEEYLRNTKGLHNMLYAYSPGGPIKDEADYASRYPGDEYVDIIGFDMYHREPQKQDNWMDELDRTEKAVAHFATRHGKVAAGTEVGMIENMNGGCLLKRGAKRPDWFNEVLAKTAPNDIAYFMTWSNFNENNFCQPYMVDTKRGHEMINSFTQFYNNPETVFAHSNADYMELNVKAAAAAETYGYITSPGAFDRELGAFQLTANVFGKPHKAQFILKRKDGTQAAVIDAVLDGAGHATAEADEEDLAQLGVTVGQAALVIDDREVDSVAVLYNMPAPEADPYLVDDFESYYGDEGILKGAYSTNSGAASYVTPALVTAADEHEAGESGLAFHYHIAKGGYTGIIKNLKGVDWSKADAVQFWLKPDGKAQKLIVQLNSGGEDFEVDLTELAKTTAAKVITLPFSEFKGKNGGTFDKSAVQHFAIYCNTIGNDTVDSTMYFDDIKAVEQ
jgi:mannan endo-1,4-beta-mannosidase